MDGLEGDFLARSCNICTPGRSYLCSECSDYDSLFGRCDCHGFPDCECGYGCVVLYPPKDDLKELVKEFEDE